MILTRIPSGFRPGGVPSGFKPNSVRALTRFSSGLSPKSQLNYDQYQISTLTEIPSGFRPDSLKEFNLNFVRILIGFSSGSDQNPVRVLTILTRGVLGFESESRRGSNRNFVRFGPKSYHDSDWISVRIMTTIESRLLPNTIILID